MSFQKLKDEYIKCHWQAMTDDIKQHLNGFVAMVETSDLTRDAAIDGLEGLGYKIIHPDNIAFYSDAVKAYQDRESPKADQARTSIGGEVGSVKASR